jgi:ATP-dependent protease HslVU (ClpYQ) ATPase subunit
MSPASQMTPAEIVSELDRHIVGQDHNAFVRCSKLSYALLY